MSRLIIFLMGMALGTAILYFFFWPQYETETITIERTKTDTVYFYQRDTIRITEEKIIQEFVRDTIIKEKSYPINRFSGLEPTLFGDIGYSGLVAGHLLRMNLYPNFKVPQITNTIERENTRTIIQKPRGLYGTGGINNEFQYSLGATYLNDRSLFGYEYQPQLGVHSVRVGWKLF